MALVVMAAFPRPKQYQDYRKFHAVVRTGLFCLRLQKAGGLTVSHLRVSEQPIRSAYLISRADFVGCHQLQFIDKYQMAERLKRRHFPAQHAVQRS